MTTLRDNIGERNRDFLFVLSQNSHIVEAVKSSKLSKIFKMIVFVEKELYSNPNLNIPQPIELGAQVINSVNINTFLLNMQNHDILKEINKENVFILSVQNFLQKLTDVSNNENVNNIEIVEMVNVHFVHNDICTYSIGCPARFPQVYFEELKSVSKVLGEKLEGDSGENKINIFGYDKTLGSLFSELKDLDSENWCKEFNDFNKKEQILNVLNQINFTPIILNKMQYENHLDLSRTLSNFTQKILLKDSLANVLNQFKLKTNINFDYVVGIEGDGAILGYIISDLLNIPFVPVKKELPCKGESYDYDSYKVQQNLIELNKNILIVDTIIEDGLTQKSVNSLLNFFFPNLTVFFGLGLNKNNLEQIKENMEDLLNNILTL